jgi:hypothetical protein
MITGKILAVAFEEGRERNRITQPCPDPKEVISGEDDKGSKNLRRESVPNP